MRVIAEIILRQDVELYAGADEAHCKAAKQRGCVVAAGKATPRKNGRIYPHCVTVRTTTIQIWTVVGMRLTMALGVCIKRSDP